MYSYEKSLRVGLTAVLWALMLRLFCAGFPIRMAEFTMLSMEQEVGRSSYRPDFMESPPPFFQPEYSEETPDAVPEETVLTFSGEDAAALSVYYGCSLRPDLQALLERPVDFGESMPAVLILSTHATESYRKNGESYTESAAYRTLDESYNMLSIGTRVGSLLEAQGIRVIRDESLHDYPSYNGAYSHARKAIAANLAVHPEIRLVLDLHRDAADNGSGQLRTRAKVAGQDSAQLMLVMGTNAGGLQHDGWEDNLSLALKLQIQLERLAPGITRPLSLRRQRFNQDLCPGSLLVEVGAAGNSHPEALRAAEVLAEAVADIIKGSAG